jgi:anti-anti-sigma regulatory factor/ligand-binding sensor protein
MKLKIDDIIDVSKNQKLLDSFCDSVGIAAAIIDLEGKLIIGSRWQNICTDFFRANEQSCKRCIESDTELSGRLQDGEKYSLYRCKNGLTDAASPIVIEGSHVANAFVGQFLLETPDIDFFKEQAKKFGFNEKAFLQALTHVPIMEETKLPVILNFLVSYAELLAEMVLNHKRQLDSEKRLSQAAQEILELSVPIIQVWEGIIAAPLIGILDSHRTSLFMEILLSKIVETKSPICLIDITGVPSVDTQTAQHLMEAVTSAKLLGTKVILTGISPSIAQTIVHLGIDFKEFHTCATLYAGVQTGIKLLGNENSYR